FTPGLSQVSHASKLAGNPFETVPMKQRQGITSLKRGVNKKSDLLLRKADQRSFNSSHRASVPKEFDDCANHVVLLLGSQLRINRQREGFFSSALSDGKVPFLVSEIRKAFLQMQWHRIIDVRAHATLAQVLAQRIAAAAVNANHELVKDVARAAPHKRHFNL